MAWLPAALALAGLLAGALCLAGAALAQQDAANQVSAADPAPAVIGPAPLATIHVYRTKSLMGLGVYFDVYAGDEKVCHLREGQYCTLQVPPGEVEIWSKFMTKGAVTLDVRAAQEYYVKASVTKGFFLFWRPHLVEVMERVGKGELSRCDHASE
ncbi:hypothetical protein [Humidesulfovibrio sp.]|uniref:hypothetical protein n=1 Tax=Humidesulfovibrio sp. TaxID=2910988 RepID=UPI002D80E088|nr:hypothetical protein [Humidesulfovibrio sp.]